MLNLQDFLVFFSNTASAKRNSVDVNELVLDVIL